MGITFLFHRLGHTQIVCPKTIPKLSTIIIINHPLCIMFSIFLFTFHIESPSYLLLSLFSCLHPTIPPDYYIFSSLCSIKVELVSCTQRNLQSRYKISDEECMSLVIGGLHCKVETEIPVSREISSNTCFILEGEEAKPWSFRALPVHQSWHDGNQIRNLWS